jgi:hypothetical protein
MINGKELIVTAGFGSAIAVSRAKPRPARINENCVKTG